jgi:Tol biopolymer transport system component
MRYLPTRIALSLAMAGCVALAGSGLPARAVFPGTNGKIVYLNHGGGDYEVFTMNADGSAKTQLTDDPVDESGPVFSADGTKIAFVKYTNDADAELYTMWADGSHVVRLTNNAYGDIDPAWSPDGTKIAYASKADGDFDLVTVNADGTGRTWVTSNNVPDREPVWSPDGTKLLYTHMANDDHYDIYRIKPDGTNSTRITDCYAGLDCVTADWSPNGTQITYTRWNFNTITSEVWIANADGSHASMQTGTGSYFNYSCFSPDGASLLYSGGANLNIFRLDLATGDVTKLTDTGPDQYGPDWGRA